MIKLKNEKEQLRKINGVSIESLDDKMVDDIYVVTAKAKDKSGRIDQAKGAVVIGHLKGEAKANAIMKAETKAKRRVTLSICGMGWTDESEIDSIPDAQPIDIDLATSEIQSKPTVVTISKEQAHNLEILLGECEESYRKWVYRALKKQYNIEENQLDRLPFSEFDKIKTAATKNMEETYAKQKSKDSPEILAVEAQ